MTDKQDNPQRRLPGVDEILRSAEAVALLWDYPRSRVLDGIREVLAGLRRTPNAIPDAIGALVGKVQAWLEEAEFERLRPVINATGVILHTNLGRAVLPDSAVQGLAQLGQCCNLQIDLENGQRGKRNYMSERLICQLTGAEAAVIVNNNAAATLLVLAALCAGREVVISRGQLIEIGGAFRMPDCIEQAGARMVEVGTTNKTHLRDYQHALTEHTAAVLKVNPSNYRIQGFVKEVSVGELVTLKAQHPDLVVIDDLGCGALIDTRRFGLPGEPTVQESLRAGADVALFSGDKLIGGPQAGIIVGRKEIISRIRKHPLTRILRVCKLTDMALEKTLRLFLEPERLHETNPTWRMLAADVATLRERAELILADAVAQGAAREALSLVDSEATMGGGALPAHPIPSCAIAVKAPGHLADEVLLRFRRLAPPVIGRITNDAVLLDMRTILPGEEAVLAKAIAKVCGTEGENLDV
jgi:L-seryl-tRNA(Ser) seleniumtransferase